MTNNTGTARFFSGAIVKFVKNKPAFGKSAESRCFNSLKKQENIMNIIQKRKLHSTSFAMQILNLNKSSSKTKPEHKKPLTNPTDTMLCKTKPLTKRNDKSKLKPIARETMALETKLRAV